MLKANLILSITVAHIVPEIVALSREWPQEVPLSGPQNQSVTGGSLALLQMAAGGRTL